MNATTILQTIRARGGQVTLEGDHIRVRKTSGVLTDELRQAIRAEKAALVTMAFDQRFAVVLIGPSGTASSPLAVRRSRQPPWGPPAPRFRFLVPVPGSPFPAPCSLFSRARKSAMRAMCV